MSDPREVIAETLRYRWCGEWKRNYAHADSVLSALSEAGYPLDRIGALMGALDDIDVAAFKHEMGEMLEAWELTARLQANPEWQEQFAAAEEAAANGTSEWIVQALAVAMYDRQFGPRGAPTDETGDRVAHPDDFEHLAEAAAAVLAPVISAATAVLEVVDPEPGDGLGVGDLSPCPYYRKQHRGMSDEDAGEGAHGLATCGFGCVDEPSCETCVPADGWPIMRLRGALASLEEVAW